MKRALVVGLLMLASCLTTPTPWVGPGSGDRVAVAGDSLTHAAENGPGLSDPENDQFLTDELNAAGFQASISAMIGAKTADLSDITWPEPGPDTIVLALGTNDMNGGNTSVATATSRIAAHAARWPDACLVLVGVTELPTPWDLETYAPPYNQAIAAMADVYVDWTAIATGHPEYFGSDGIHHTEVGRAAYRAAIVNGATQCHDRGGR